MVSWICLFVTFIVAVDKPWEKYVRNDKKQVIRRIIIPFLLYICKG
ncbi:hypothetical protein GGQ57_002651 [Parabacteroides faecis]|uniref:Uncharacterized protein n=1 Tax=Parabacteroides faecis TaxID=1217282 RepID=A0ABR6KMV7_9BACT|nr:hypothetical protein [Parabacteroides faecis]